MDGRHGSYTFTQWSNWLDKNSSGVDVILQLHVVYINMVNKAVAFKLLPGLQVSFLYSLCYING